MDFDDLDDEIEARLAAGDTEGLENFAFEKKELKAFAPGSFLPPIPTSTGLFVSDIADSGQARVRAFIFYGAGDKAEDFKVNLGSYCMSCPWMQTAVHEWPGRGTRADEAAVEDVDALAQDALTQLNDALSEVAQDGAYEGAPFAFIGRSVGCQVMTVLAKKILMTFGMAPCAVIVMDRAPLQFPLLSDEGQETLKSDPDKVVKAFNAEEGGKLASNRSMMDQWAKDLSYACETKDSFFHKYECDMLLLKGTKDKSINASGKKSKYTMTQLRVKGKEEYFQMPVESKTTVNELMTAVSSIFAYKRGTALTALDKDGKEIAGSKTVDDTMIVDGLDDFRYPRHTWPHPVGIIGGGFYGVKLAMMYHLRKNYNVVLFDRHKQAGGDAWHLSATKYSRCQTDYGAFNIWYGYEFCNTGDAGFGTEKGGRSVFTKSFLGPGSPMDGTVASGAGTGVDYHPVRHQILEGMRYALKEYNLEDCSYFESQVDSLEIVGAPDWEGRSYKLGVTSLKEPPEPEKTVKVSVVCHFPGAYDITRIVDYPGEKEFLDAGGQIGYGMGNGQGGEFKFNERMVGARAAILGNGAFAVENVRSCVEEGASKVYIITRRKSLLCPRMPCWFCHQGPQPTPAGFLLKMFEPMYKAAGIDNPWDFYAVTKVGKTDAKITQSSRFGIGDVTFLCHAVGLFEYRVDTVSRFSAGAIHMEKSGEKIELQHVCKALGLLGDPRVDKLHAMTHRKGNMINGDWRRVMTSDATGMDAQRFTTFSAGPGAYQFVRIWHHLHTHPWEVYQAMKNPMWEQIPRHEKNANQLDQPVYQVNVQYEMHAGIAFSNCFNDEKDPSLIQAYMQGTMTDEPSYKYALLHTMHPVEKFLDYAKADWDRYQDLIHAKNPGFADAPRVEYPYTKEMVQGWFGEYNDLVKSTLRVPTRPEGPSQAEKNQALAEYESQEHALLKNAIPHLISESKYLHNLQEGENPISEALASMTYIAKRDLTASKPESAMDFDDEQYDAWKDTVSTDYTFTCEEIDAYSKDLLRDPKTWTSIATKIATKL